MVIVPDRSVRYTAAPDCRMRASVCAAGWPKRLSAPAEMKTASGRHGAQQRFGWRGGRAVMPGHQHRCLRQRVQRQQPVLCLCGEVAGY